MRRIGFLVWKELLELKADPRLVGIVVVAPLLQLFMLGYAATTDIRNVPVVVADADRSVASRELIARFQASPSFSIVSVVGGLNDADFYLERGTAWMALAIPSGFGAGIEDRRPQTLQIVADGSDANSATVSLGYAGSLIAAYGRDRAVSMHALPAVRAGIEPRVRVWYNARLESRDFMIPGVVALLLLVITTNLSSMGIVREKELGTLEQLNVTPLRRWELIVGKLLPYALVGMLDVLLVIGVALLWFQIPLRGSFWLLIALTGVYLLSTLGLGLFVSTISSTQQQAMMTTMFFFLTPMIYLSGFIFPIENMPAVIQPLTYLIPLRYFLVIVRSIFLKGVGLETLWPQALALAGWGVAILGLAIARSSKRTA
ncbi:MAG TPA: ABC transporter permease [Vicinamibacterales bacterium]|jgi:ABC-2 type transport system permease protein|nr:ABC transporter permease [Vicinamibacterales bacterium]